MAPFPETEIMTIKRIEVALRKMDLRLLKDGTYKLHEKFHSGHNFEYVDVLKEILNDVLNNSQIPQDIKDILIPTIEDILENSSNTSSTRVSNLTSLSYTTSNESENNISTTSSVQVEQENPLNEETPKLSAFDAFKGDASETKTYVQSPFSAQPFQEFKPVEPPRAFENISNGQAVNQFEPNYLKNMNIVQPPKEDEPVQTINENVVPQEENKEGHKEEYNQETYQEVNQEQCQEIKTIAIFYNQNSSNEKNRNILRYRKILQNENIDLREILGLLQEINVQSNTNVSELKSILEQLNTKNHLVNLITNSNSRNLVELLKATDIKFTLNTRQDDIKLNILPILGLTNQFKCTNCKQEILNDSNLLNSLILECPNCKSPMFPNLYAVNNSIAELDMDNYNNSLIALANSKIWLIINPSLDEKVSLNLLRSALKVSHCTEEIFIIDKDINVRETYKNLFQNINENVKINTQISVIEDFFNVVK